MKTIAAVKKIFRLTAAAQGAAMRHAAEALWRDQRNMQEIPYMSRQSQLTFHVRPRTVNTTKIVSVMLPILMLQEVRRAAAVRRSVKPFAVSNAGDIVCGSLTI